MGFNQLRNPNLNQTDSPGWCLRFTRNSFGVGPKYASAWEAWQGSPFKHMDALPNVAVPVWFSWTGTIDGITKNWGDCAIWVPGRGVFGTPLRGGGNSNRWFNSVEERARLIGGGAQYVGWTEDVNGVKVVEHVADPVPPQPQPQPPADCKELSEYTTDELMAEIVRRYK